MTIDIDAIRRREQAATPGPWTMRDGWGPSGQGVMRFRRIANSTHDGVIEATRDGELAAMHADAEFIAAARTHVPALCDEVEQLHAELDRVRAELDTNERSEDARLAIAEDELGKARTELAYALHHLTGVESELDRVRADLAAAHNHAHRQDTNLQQITRAKDEIAAERDALKAEQMPVRVTIAAAIRAIDSGAERGTRPLAEGIAAALNGIGAQWHPATINELINQVGGWDELGAAELAHHLVTGLAETRAEAEVAR